MNVSRVPAVRSQDSAGLLAVVVICGLLLGCSAGPGRLPKWVERPPDDDVYLYAVGIRTGAATMEEARQGAIEQGIGELVRRFGVTSETSYEELRTEVETRVRDEIQSASRRIRIEGAVIREMQGRRGERGFDAFVLLRYPRSRAENESARLRSEEAAGLHAAHQALRVGDRARSRGEVAAALAAYVDAAERAGASAAGAALRSQAVEHLAELRSALRIEFLAEQGQPVRNLAPFAGPLQVRASIGETPAVGLPLRFEVTAGSAHISPEAAITDGAGIASVSMTRIRPASGGLVVRVRLDLQVSSTDRTSQRVIEDLARVNAELRLAADHVRLPIRVAVVMNGVAEGGPACSAVLAVQLMGDLHAAGFRVVAEDDLGHDGTQAISPQTADIVLAGWCETRPGSENLGWATSVLADAGVRAVVVATGEVVAVCQIIGQVGFGEREDRARAEAIKAAAARLAEEITVQLTERYDEAVRQQDDTKASP